MLPTDYTYFRRLDNANLAVARVKAVLEELRQMKMHLAVPTNSISARPFLDRCKPAAFFAVIVTGDEIQRGKAHPDI